MERKDKSQWGTNNNKIAHNQSLNETLYNDSSYFNWREDSKKKTIGNLSNRTTETGNKAIDRCIDKTFTYERESLDGDYKPSTDDPSRFLIKIPSNGRTLLCFIDSGSDISLMKKSVANKFADEGIRIRSKRPL